ncbi:MAG: GNAT family N-acetyltransferase [Terriglobales bacterium]
MLKISQAESAEQIAAVRELFLEYAQSLGFSLCFQSFDRELAGLPGDYAPPCGRLLLATMDQQPAGCVALHLLQTSGTSAEQKQVPRSARDDSRQDDVCEMERLYVRPQFRGLGAGRRLAEALIAEARAIGYSHIRLDTVEPMMQRAVSLYRALGFREIPAYRENPIQGALYMELKL